MDTEACTGTVIHEQFVAVCFHVLVFFFTGFLRSRAETGRKCV